MNYHDDLEKIGKTKRELQKRLREMQDEYAISQDDEMLYDLSHLRREVNYWSNRESRLKRAIKGAQQ